MLTRQRLRLNEIIYGGFAIVLSFLPRTLEGLRTHFLAHYPAPAATQANTHCDPFRLLLMTRERLADFAPSVGTNTGPPANPAEGKSGIRNADAVKSAYVNFLMGCAIMLNDGCMEAALRYEDEVFVEGAEGAPTSLPHRFLVGLPPSDINAARLNTLLAGDHDSINELYAKMSDAQPQLERAAKALKWGDKIEANSLMAHRRLFSQKLGKSKGKQRLGTRSVYSMGHQTTGASASSSRKRQRTQSTRDTDHAVAEEVIANNPQASRSQSTLPQEGGWPSFTPASHNPQAEEDPASMFFNLQAQGTSAATPHHIPTQGNPFLPYGPVNVEGDLLTGIDLQDIFPEFVPGSSHDGNSGGFQS